MNKKYALVISLIILLTLVLQGCVNNPVSTEISDVLDFTLKNFDGKDFTLASLKSEYDYLLVDFSNKLCGDCQTEAGFMNDLVKGVRDKGYKFESVTVLMDTEDIADLMKWSTTYSDLEYVLGLDGSKDLFDKYHEACGGDGYYPYNVLLKLNKGIYECIKAGFHMDDATNGSATIQNFIKISEEIK